MNVYNYLIEVLENESIERLIQYCVKHTSMQQANLAVMVAVVNHNMRYDNRGYILHHARLVSINKLDKS